MRAAAVMLAAAAFAPALALAAADFGPARLGKDAKGRPLLENPAGRTLYVYGKDPVGGGQSRCTDTCVNSWRPFNAAEPAARKAQRPWTVIARDDGTHQWAYKGRPLYTFYRDPPHDGTRGDDFEGGKWRVARP